MSNDKGPQFKQGHFLTKCCFYGHYDCWKYKETFLRIYMWPKYFTDR